MMENGNLICFYLFREPSTLSINMLYYNILNSAISTYFTNVNYKL